jgi:hypothetical protein
MSLRHLLLSLAVTGLLAPATLLAADSDSPKPAAEKADAKPTADKADAKPDKPKAAVTCEHVTGTRIQPSPKNGCQSPVKPYRTFSQEELQRTGEIDQGEALKKLDPIFH